MTGRRVLGAVLAGGRSRRFGSDKAQAELGGQLLIGHALASLRRSCDAVAVCGREMAGVTSLPDRPAPDMGPLGGLNAALHHAVTQGFDGVLSIGCDMPLLPEDLAALLIGDGAAIVGGQHLVGFWPGRLAAGLDARLAAADDRSIRGWLAEVTPRVVALPGPPLPNVNTHDDLVALRARWPGRDLR